jgi:hypothetical protein
MLLMLYQEHSRLSLRKQSMELQLDEKKIRAILEGSDKKLKRAFFAFNSNTDDDTVIWKFNVWGMYFFPNYFKSEDADFHDEINRDNLAVYRGSIEQFVDIAFRGAGKDVKTKLFIAFVIANDIEHFRKYFKVLAADGDNSKQSVTDIYNMLVRKSVQELYPEIFQKTDTKREERMSSFTTSTGVKIVADTVGVEQRGAVQDETRPDFVWFNDFETRKTLRSRVEGRAIWENMEEARTGLEKGGGCIYTCNYISEQGNVHKLVVNHNPRKVVLIVPIEDENGEPTWDRYTKEDIAHMRKTDDDFEGERMCRPSASKDVYFDRVSLERMTPARPIRDIAGFKMYREYKSDHRYGLGADIAGGVGLDSSATVIIDFSTTPAQVVGTFFSNTIAPESFGDEMYSQANRFGGCLIAPENNRYDSAILKVKMLGGKLYQMKPDPTKVRLLKPVEYGWNTNPHSKTNMLDALRGAIEDGLIQLNDPDLIAEAKSYTRNDLLEDVKDPRLATNHFDLLIACCIAWQLRADARPKSTGPKRTPSQWQKTSSPKNPAL